jgi:hypothetical protein
MAYDHSHGAVTTLPDNIDYSGNIISICKDCGIYAASPLRMTVKNNLIRGQTSSADGTLPKGAIAINQVTYASLDGNTITDSYFGVEIVVATGMFVRVKNTTIMDVSANGYGMKITPTGTGTVGDVVINGLEIDSANASTTGVQVGSTSSIGLANFALRNFKINVTQTGIIQFDASGGSDVPAIGTVHMANGEISNVANYGINWVGCSNSATRAVFENIAFFSPVAGAVLFDVIGSYGLTVRDITFCDMTTGAGYCWSADNARGRLSGVQYANVGSNNRYSGNSDLGTALPSGWGDDNDFVQNLNPTEAGSTSSKYCVMGWTFDKANSAWKACRTLTGN